MFFTPRHTCTIHATSYFFKVSVIVTKFKSLLIPNGCQLTKLECELDILREPVAKFLLCVTPIRSWPQIFALKHALRVHNILHVIELGIALPIGNAESERVFSFLWDAIPNTTHSVTKEQSSSSYPNTLLFRPSCFDKHLTSQCNRPIRPLVVRGRRKCRKSLWRKFQMTSLSGLKVTRVTMTILEDLI